MMESRTNGPHIPQQVWLFMQNFFRHPTMLGSLVPSSTFLVNDVLAQIDWDRADVLVEYGPGVGTITQEILKRMRSDARLVAIELNPQFVHCLRTKFRDSRLHVIHGSALDARRVLAEVHVCCANYIISGIPYSTIPHPVRRSILEQARHILTPDGALLVYQFTDAVLPYLTSSFGSVRKSFQWLNILPARIFYCTR
jgi:phospholipid N-methyltransferase